MADWDMTPEEYQAEYDAWYKEYEITEFIDVSTKENIDAVTAMDPKYVWTNHGTCEDEKNTPGVLLMGDIEVLGQKAGGCGCWQTAGFYIANKPWDIAEGEEWKLCVDTSAYLPCSKCNPNGDDELDEDLLDPDCELCWGDGFATYYFD